jgi:hypothetical protein
VELHNNDGLEIPNEFLHSTVGDFVRRMERVGMLKEAEKSSGPINLRIVVIEKELVSCSHLLLHTSLMRCDGRNLWVTTHLNRAKPVNPVSTSILI